MTTLPKAKKSLGQHFLTRPSIAARIAEAAQLSHDDAVLEIGPGRGILTKELLARAGRVIAIEKDAALIETLRERFASELAEGKLKLIEGDALDPRVLAPLCGSCPHTRGYKVVANIPYYITGELLRSFLECKQQPSAMVLLVQKEVAKRVVARDGKESILSISVKVYGKPRLISAVKAGSFSPPPNVDSAILAIENISRANFATCEEETRFFHIVKTGFAQKRKKLAGNLKPMLNEPQDALSACGIDPDTRAENLALTQWLCLAKEESF